MTINRDAPEHLLDNAAWHSLAGPHAAFAVGTGAARRYHPDVSVFFASEHVGDRAWKDLAALAEEDGTVVVFRGTSVDPPAGWEYVQRGFGHQMLLTSAPKGVPRLPDLDPVTGEPVSFRVLTTRDVDDMLALVALAQPGPFRPRTIELGGYVGIFHGNRLVAMAGQRLRLPGYCEISAVSTHPDARRRGYASIVTAHVATAIAARGETPFLHVAQTNTSARAVYEQLGFFVRKDVNFAVLRAPR